MERLIEYVTRHPFLTGGTFALFLAALAYEASRARSGGESVGPMDAVRLMNQGALLLDVRSQAEFDSGHIRDARHLPQEQLAGSGEALKKYKDKVVVACCESGMRSGAAARKWIVSSHMPPNTRSSWGARQCWPSRWRPTS